MMITIDSALSLQEDKYAQISPSFQTDMQSLHNYNTQATFFHAELQLPYYIL